jgi:hypothetical protein
MSDRSDLFHELQSVLAGRSEAAVMQALLQCLLVIIGVSAPDQTRAEELIDALPAELKPALEKQWLNFRLHRAKAEAGPGVSLPADG